MTGLLKVCGATSRADVEVLHAAGADLVGLWHGVPGGRADLDGDGLVSLAAACRSTRVLDPVLVTFLGDPDEIVGAARAAHIRWLQLHGYQPPGAVAAVKRSLPEATVLKALHVQGGECVERPLLGSYERAGVDVFLLDAVDGDKVGSTGLRLDRGAASALVERTTVPFLLAGGISADSRGRYEDLATHPRFAGIDVDTAARNASGVLSRDLVDAIRRHWSVPADHEGAA